jgi:hypothetical protein
LVPGPALLRCGLDFDFARIDQPAARQILVLAVLEVPKEHGIDRDLEVREVVDDPLGAGIKLGRGDD